MAYSLTSAANPKALLAAIVTFAAAQGWTTEYDKSSGVGTGVGGQIALSSDGCHVAIGEASATENPIAVVGNLGADNDARLYMALANSITTSSWQFWGHPGSLVTAFNDGDRVIINDLVGPMDEVHFFGDEDYILCNVKCAAQRWTAFGFGNIDKKAMAISSCGFCFSNFVEWWGLSGGTSAPQSNASLVGHQAYIGSQPFGGFGSVMSVRIPDAILDTSFGFASGNVYAFMLPATSARHVLLDHAYHGFYPESTLGENAPTRLLDHTSQMRNQPTTGGAGLAAIPIMYLDTTTKLSTFLGDIPGLRICRMSNLSPGQTITYGSDEYLVFPWKQKGTVQDAGFLGGTYNGQPNSFDMGYAFRKD